MCSKRWIVLVAVSVMAASALLVESAHAQESARKLGRFRALQYDGKRVEGSKGLLTSSTLTGTDEAGKAIELPTTEITSLEYVSGSKAATGAVVGVGFGLLTGLLAVLQVSLDDQYEVDESAAVAVTAGLAVGSGLIGAVIGANIKEWKTVRLHSGLSFHAGPGSDLCLLSIPF